MKNVLLVFVVTSCVVLGSCLSDGESKQANLPQNVVSTVPTEEAAAPSILDCPADDVAEYPVSELLPMPWEPNEPLRDGWCGRPLKISAEKLSFGTKGGGRCIVTSDDFLYARDARDMRCRPPKTTERLRT